MKATTKRKIHNFITTYMVVCSVLFTGWVLWAIPQVVMITWGHVTSWAMALKSLVPLS